MRRRKVGELGVESSSLRSDVPYLTSSTKVVEPRRKPDRPDGCIIVADKETTFGSGPILVACHPLLSGSPVVACFLLAVAVAVAVAIGIAVIVAEKIGATLAGRGAVVDGLSDQLVKGRELVVLAYSRLLEVGKVCKTSLLCEVDEQRDLCFPIVLLPCVYCILQQALELLALSRCISSVLESRLAQDLVS